MYKKSSNVPGEDPQKCFTRNLFWRFLFFINLQAGGWIVIKIALCCNFLKKPEVILRTTLSSCTLTMFLHLCLSIKNAYFPPNMYISFTSLFLWPCFWGKQIGLSQWQVWLELTRDHLEVTGRVQELFTRALEHENTFKK